MISKSFGAAYSFEGIPINLMFMAEIDLWPGNIKAMAQTSTGKVPIKNGNRFAFNGTDQIDFEDAQENLYFSLPSDYAWAANDSTGENIVPVFRVFNTQQGRHYMFVGVPWAWVNAAPKGPLIIDPTITIDNNLDDVTRDTRLQSATNYGTDVILMAGKRSGAGKKRSLLKFDFAYSGIPSNATILNSQLNLYYYSAVASSGVPWLDRWVQAHQVLKDWDELQATRDNRLTGTAWAAQYGALNGTDAAATMESTMLFQDNQTGTWKVWNLTSLTQKWINGTAANNGVILWATNEDTEAHDLRFYSRENATNQPKLEVTWSNTPKTVYFLKDHLGSVRATVDQTGAVVGYDDYDPWGYALAGRTMATQWSDSQSVAENKFTGKEWDDEYGVNWFHYGWRPYDPEIARWFIVDQVNDYYSPYVYVRNNPVSFFDADGRSTVTDSTGKVIHVNTEDNDLSVYRAQTVTGSLNEFGMGGGPMSVKEKVGETQFIDEFIDPESGAIGGTIIFGESWQPAIDALHADAMKMDLAEIASNSTAGKKFDVKANSELAPHGEMTGKLLDGKYATARSAGNYLAGYNAYSSSYWGVQVSWESFMKMAGAVHTGNWSRATAVQILLTGKSFGPAPWYGEIPYAGRMIHAGWNRK